MVCGSPKKKSRTNIFSEWLVLFVCWAVWCACAEYRGRYYNNNILLDGFYYILYSLLRERTYVDTHVDVCVCLLSSFRHLPPYFPMCMVPASDVKEMGKEKFEATQRQNRRCLVCYYGCYFSHLDTMHDSSAHMHKFTFTHRKIENTYRRIICARNCGAQAVGAPT